MRQVSIAMVIFFILCFAQLASADMEAVQAGYGSLILGGVFQAGFNYHLGDENLDYNTMQAVDRDSVAEFTINRARLIFKGMIVDDSVRYFVQLDLVPNPDEGYNEDNIRRDIYQEDPEESELPPTLLDMKIGFKYIPYTTIWFGRFAPNFTYFNAMNVGKLGLIDYPLMNQFLGVQRQSGVIARIYHRWFEIETGGVNGLNFDNFAYTLNPADRALDGKGLGNETWGDENTMKDVYATVAIKPVRELRIWSGYWYGRPLDYFELNSGGEKKQHNAKMAVFNGGIRYASKKIGLTIMGEAFYSKLKYDNEDPQAELRNKDFLELETLSYYGRLGFNMKELVGIPIELVGQYDWLDPDMENDENTHGADDALTYITGGLNWYLSDWHAMLSFNYLYKDEEWKVLEKDGSGKQTGLEDDEFKIQAQIGF